VNVTAGGERAVAIGENIIITGDSNKV